MVQKNLNPVTKIICVIHKHSAHSKLKGKSQDATAYNIDDATLDEIIGKLTAK